MKIKRYLLVLIIVLSMIGLPACKLPASTAIPATPTTESGFPVPGTETMGLFEKIATETAQAAIKSSTKPTEKPGTQPKVTPTPKPIKPTAEKTKAPVKTKVVVPSATPGIPANYTLQKGEYIYCIARRFNINPDDLMNANKLNRNSTVYPGMKLTIPQNARHFPGARALHKHPTSYTVRTGDTVYTVACYFGDVDPMAITQANSLKSPYTLTAGKSIQIP